MALSERLEIGHIGIVTGERIEVREDTIIERDGVEVSRTYHRFVLEPGDKLERDTPGFPRVRAVANALWTPAVVRAAQDRKRDSGGNR